MNKSKKSNSSLIKEIHSNSFTFFDLGLIVSKNIKVILFIPSVICTICIIYLLFFSQPIYVSTSKIMSSNNSGGVSQAAGIAAQFGISLPTNTNEQIWVYPEVIKSKRLAKKILKRKFDTKKFGEQKTLFQIMNQNFNESDISSDTSEAIAIENFLSSITLDEDIKTTVFTLNFSSIEPSLSYEVNKAIIEELDLHQKEYQKKNIKNTRLFIEDRINAIEKELILAEERLKNFNDRNRRIENSPSLILDQQRLSREVTVLIGVFTTLKQQYETTKIEEVKITNYVIVIDPPDLPIYPAKPRKKVVLIVWGFIGIFIAVAYALFLESLSKIDVHEKKKMMEIKKHLTKSINTIRKKISNF